MSPGPADRSTESKAPNELYDVEPERTRRPRRSGGTSLELGRWLGVRVRADASLLIVFALLVWDLGYRLFPRWHSRWSTFESWSVAICTALAFVLSVLVHELSHAVVARKQGIRVHGITLFLFGGVAHLESEPASPEAELLLSIVGPVTSFVLGIVALVVGTALVAPPAQSIDDLDTALRVLRDAGPVATLLLWLGPINVALAVFNLLPGFPLDGGRVLRAALWAITRDVAKATAWSSNVGRAVAWGLIALGVASMLRGAFLQGLWLVLIGWFLNSAAILGYRTLLAARGLLSSHEVHA